MACLVLGDEWRIVCFLTGNIHHLQSAACGPLRSSTDLSAGPPRRNSDVLYFARGTRLLLASVRPAGVKTLLDGRYRPHVAAP